MTQTLISAIFGVHSFFLQQSEECTNALSLTKDERTNAGRDLPQACSRFTAQSIRAAITTRRVKNQKRFAFAMRVAERSASTQVSPILLLLDLITCLFSVKLVLAALRYGQVLSRGYINFNRNVFFLAFVKKSF